MKSAFELAMERLEKSSGPTRKLSDQQKSRIAEIDKIYEAKIAETKLTYEARMRGAESMEAFNQVKQEQAETLASIEQRREKEKEEAWNAP
jgi:L-amino acid N-acyltransferase YncA